MLRNLRWICAYFAVGLIGLSAQAQIRLSIEKGDGSNEIVLSGVVDYGAVLSPAHALKNNLQDKLNAAFQCGTPGNYSCDEYPIGRIVGDKKFLQIEKEPDHWEDPVVKYTDKKQERSITIPIEISRHFPAASISDFRLLNEKEPGADTRAFVVQPKSLGDTLIKVVPDRNALYTHVCQILPGASIANNQFSGTYTYLHKKVFGKTIDLSIDFEGHLGGASFDALKICSLTKTEVKNNMNITSTLDILPPVAYNIQRIPLEIEIASQSWLVLVLIAIVLAAILIMIPGAIFKILAVISLVIGAAIGILGSMSSSLATKYANQQVDKAIENYLGVKVADFNSEIWAKKLKYDNLPIFKDETVSEGEFKDGSWAATFLSKKLLKDHQLLAQVSVNLALEKYFGQYSLPTQESLKPVCENLETRILDKLKGISLSKQDSESIANLASRVKNLCLQINLNVKMDMFLPLDKSRNIGCYDSFIRLEEVQDQRATMLNFLKDKLDSSSGGTYQAAVKDAVVKRINDVTNISMVQASNWWAQQDRPAFCGFDNRLTLSYTVPEEARFVACFIKELKLDHDLSGGIETLIDRVETTCKMEIRALSGGTK